MSGADTRAVGARARSFSTTAATGAAAAAKGAPKRRSPRAVLPSSSDHKGDFDAFKVGVIGSVANIVMSVEQ